MAVRVTAIHPRSTHNNDTTYCLGEVRLVAVVFGIRGPRSYLLGGDS